MTPETRRTLEAAFGLLQQGRLEDALRLTTPLSGEGAAAETLNLHGQILRAMGRPDEAVEALRRVIDGPDPNPVFVHNLAATLIDAERYAEAERAAGQAIARGIQVADSWRVRGRALLGLDRFDEAETAYRDALRRQPDLAGAHRDLAQLIWMRTEDAAAATETLDTAIAAWPGNPSLRIIKAKLLEYAGDAVAGYGALAPLAGRADSDPLVEMTAAQLAITIDPDRALAHAERALAAAPHYAGFLAVAAETSLAAGQPDRADRRAETMLAQTPHDQQALGLLTAAWRLLDDPRYRDLCDYEVMVKTWRLDPPDGWPSLEAWLADLQRALEAMHGLKGHPVGQSLRQGSQTSQSLDRSDNPAVRGFFDAIRGPIARHIEHLGPGSDPLRSRATGAFRLNGSWSVRLRPGGRHVNHTHPRGWLSSACYIVLPDAIETGREGWIGFGQPGVPTRPTLEAEHWVKPEPGMLVLFPSYMWHGTAPFGGDQARLTCAFDVVPA
ncbi:MAG: tetratricopeptide repeat protein [Caulobacterales bacterium]|nr:tetratricopeptide repeat protein [Caulobacterales bacterium]